MKKCIIIIKDEVNAKLTGLDLTLRQKLVNRFAYDIPHAKYTPAFKLGRWSGKANFFQLGGSTYINLLGDIIPILEKAGYSFELDDRRTYETTFSFNEVTENSLSHILWPKGHRFEGQPIVLNDHQVISINTYLNNPQSISCIATGGGKTIITGALSLAVEKYGRSLIIVPSRSLVNQTYEDYANMGLNTGVFFGTKKDYTAQHTICTWQSLNSLLKKSKAGEAEVTFDELIKDTIAVIADECHSVKAAVLSGLLSKELAKIPIRWGLTGTIPKESYEKLSLTTTIGEVIGEVTASELQDKGILAQCFIHIKQLQDNRVLGDYQSELTWLLTNGDRLDHIAEMIIEQSLSGNTLVLVGRIVAINDLALRLPPDRVSVVTGKMHVDKRKTEYDKIADTDDRIILASYGVASTGINLPQISNLVLIEPGKSFVRVIQSIGRSLRIADGKDHADIYDITSSCKFSKRHLTKRKAFYREAGYKFSVEKIKWSI